MGRSPTSQTGALQPLLQLLQQQQQRRRRRQKHVQELGNNNQFLSYYDKKANFCTLIICGVNVHQSYLEFSFELPEIKIIGDIWDPI